jgi:hypothetical protein
MCSKFGNQKFYVLSTDSINTSCVAVKKVFFYTVINELFLITETASLYCVVYAEYLSIIQAIFGL